MEYVCKKTKYLAVASLFPLLAACGGGGSEGGDGDYNYSSFLTVMEALPLANEYQAIEFLGYENVDGFNAAQFDEPMSDYTARWPDSSVDVYFEPPEEGEYTTELNNAEKALDEINNDLANQEINFTLNRVEQPPGDKSYIHVSFGTSYYDGSGDPENYCANVATEKFLGYQVFPYDSTFHSMSCKDIEPESCNTKRGELGYINAFVNISGDHINGVCATQEIIYHEFLHALGFHQHFDGYGIGASMTPLAKEVLYKLYSYPVGTDFSGIN